MVDPGAAQAVIRQLNRWYRKRAKPRGGVDHFYRGTRMSYTATYRVVMGCMASFLFLVAALCFFVPSVTEGKSPLMVLFLKLGSVGMMVLALFVLLRAAREYVVVTDDGLIKSNALGRKTRMSWDEMSQFQIKTDDNDVIFRTDAKAKMKLSLSYDGWQDFLDVAARRMEPALYAQFRYTFASFHEASPKALSKKKAWAGWFSSGRRP